MKIREILNRTFNDFGLERKEYELIQSRIIEDNRRRLMSASLIISAFLMVMLVITSIVPSLHHNRNIYWVTMLLTLAQISFALLGKRNKLWVSPGVYLFMMVAFSFGIYQGIVTAPEEQTASFIVLIVAVPVWFTMKPSYMIRFIYIFAAIYIACVLYVKTGYVRTSDIVNTVVYSTCSALISTYYTIVKSKRFYAEYLTEQMGKTDMLTGLGNRFAYSDDAERYVQSHLPDDLTYVYLDVNELKRTNDTLGHHAGDELITGAAECIKKVFGQVGSCYRMGGDEFVVLCKVSEERFADLCAEFDRTLENWSGSWVQELRVSYGGAAAREIPDGDLTQISKLADKRLYEAKALYYSSKGVDRREHQKAYRVLCESYIKILQVDLKNDTCKIIHTESSDEREQAGALGSFSGWMIGLGNSGKVHPDDLEEYRKKTDLQYLREVFQSGTNTVHIFYRRKLGDTFRAVMADLIASSDYSEDNPTIYLYVKDIDREQ